ncbi:unnamed protein product [Rhodiola kirilowii]
MSSKEIQDPIFNDDDLEESDEDSDEEEDNLNSDLTPHAPPRNLNDVLDDEEEDDVIDLDNGNDEDDGFNSDPSLVTVAVPPPAQFDNSKTNSEQKRPRIDEAQLFAVQEEKKVQQQQQPLDDSRKLFQRLWTDEDEIELLQGFLEYMTQRGISYHNHHDLGLFYEQIKSKLQLDFNKNQLVEKLRRLKRKYRNVLNRTSAGKEISFKSPHDQATYEISRKIWSDLISTKDGGAGIDDEDTAPVPIHAPPNLSPSPNYNFFNPISIPPVHHNHMNGIFDERKSQSSKKRSRVKIEEKRASDERVMLPNMGHGHGPGPGPSSSVALGPGIQGLIEETVKSCLSPLIKEALNNEANGSRGFGGVSSGVGMLSPLALNFGSPSNLLGGEVSDRKWRKQQILELEVYSKRLELVQEQIKVALEELRSGRN